MAQRNIEAVIFDCFGVLVTDALEAMVADIRSKDPAASRRISDLVGSHGRGLLGQAEFNQGISDLLGITEAEMIRRIIDGEVKNQPLLDYIEKLRKSYKTAMLSNIGAAGLEKRFEPQELERYFDVVVASGKIGFAKPEPQAYEITADRLGVRLDACVFIDDREVYLEGARNVGMQAILYQSFEQCTRDLEAAIGVVNAG